MSKRLELVEALKSGNIQQNVQAIESILAYVEEHLPDNLQEAVNMVKNAIQWEAMQSIVGLHNQSTWGLLAMATGTGKSKVPLDYIKMHGEGLEWKILIIVPTEKLRDLNWKLEFEKWGLGEVYKKSVERTCYASLHKIVGKQYDLVIGDEFHNITEAKAGFFRQNQIDVLFALTATPPKNVEKVRLLQSLGIYTRYSLDLTMAVRLRLVSPFEITLVEVELDRVTQNIPAGPAKNRFYQTEKQGYEYRERLLQAAMAKGSSMVSMRIMQRMNFIKNLVSINKSAKFILENIIPREERTLIFAGGIEQAIELSPYTYFSKPSCKKSDPQSKKDRVERLLPHYQGDDSLNKFLAKEINLIAAVDRLNEGMNIEDVAYVLVCSLNSVDTDIIQRLGRMIRYKIGHKGRMAILVPKDTQAEVWAYKALENFDKSNVRTIKFTDLLNGTTTLFT